MNSLRSQSNRKGEKSEVSPKITLGKSETATFETRETEKAVRKQDGKYIKVIPSPI